MKKFLLSCAVLLSAVSFTVYAAQENSKDKKDKRDKIECCCKDCTCKDCTCKTDCSECAGCRKNEECSECRDCRHEGHCCDYDHHRKDRRHHHRRGGWVLIPFRYDRPSQKIRLHVEDDKT